MADSDDLKQFPGKGNTCELCGRTFSPDAGGSGTQRAHIIADEHGPAHDWNLLDLCPNCHQAFDHKLKPRIVAAIIKGMRGFTSHPNQEGKKKWPSKYVVANSFEEAVRRLVKPEYVDPMDGSSVERIVWKNRPSQPPPENEKA